MPVALGVIVLGSRTYARLVRAGRRAETHSGSGADGRAALDVVHPVRVDAGGAFLSYELWPRALRKRDVSARRAAPAFYELQYRGRELRFNLTANAHLLAPGFVSETRRRGGLGRTHIRARAPACHLLGEVQDPELEGGLAAISACDGLTGVFRLSNEDYFIEPLEGVPARPGHAQPHVVYKRQAPERGAELGGSRAPGTCGVPASMEPEARRERWEQRQQWRRQRPRRLHQRSVSREKWVETLVVADTKMVEYHGQPQVESYVLTIMNMVRLRRGPAGCFLASCFLLEEGPARGGSAHTRAHSRLPAAPAARAVPSMGDRAPHQLCGLRPHFPVHREAEGPRARGRGCERDRLSFGFCETLRLLGRCQLPAVRTQCCRSCPLPGHGVPSRGHQRVARR
ncbi:A disintegrin and metalloproteinase with thrombospondin motifs 7 [Herpailurus yagouaroundi]|uniref:A disintegrin and metalloproteinase with thrombospondin motifs 7 n=1 Tax=Herpailurus yagouaroundi TaxID=1608482 RepID=UPI001AD6A910|nr:A disintegrin and metalloproteinase with thrombospondin motifs 7 [Puma yagouaroundi]